MPLPGGAEQPGPRGDGATLAAERLVSEGRHLLSMADLGVLTVASWVDELNIVKAKPNQRVRISGAAFPDLVFQGRIARVAPQSRSKANARVPFLDVAAAIDGLT